MDDIIEARGLTKDYGNGKGVFELDLSISRGEIFGFIGPNGAGKSTTIRTMLDLLRPTAGQVRIFGRDPRRHGIDIRRRIGYMPGELEMPGSWTAKTYLHHLAAIRGGVDTAYFKSLVHRLGAQLEPKIRQLSKGNKQKIGMIQALMHRPDLLILDEPTDGLDPLLRQEVHELLMEAKSEGRTVFLSSHVIHEVEQVCDRIGLIREGRLAMVDHVAAMKSRLPAWTYVQFGRDVDASRLRTLPGVRQLQARDKRHIRVRLEGSADAFVKAIARAPVERIHTERPDLEDAILYLYERQA